MVQMHIRSGANSELEKFRSLVQDEQPMLRSKRICRVAFRQLRQAMAQRIGLAA